MNNTQWHNSRATYLEYRETKRNLSRATKAEDRTWKRLEKSFTRFSRAQTAAFLEYEDASQTEKFAKAYEALRVAKLSTTHHERRSKRQFHTSGRLKSSMPW